MKRPSQNAPQRINTHDDRLYTLDVFLISGPIPLEFARKNRVVSWSGAGRARSSNFWWRV
jgi:hypothetical protein